MKRVLKSAHPADHSRPADSLRRVVSGFSEQDIVGVGEVCLRWMPCRASIWRA
ncbi:MAG: hypothetical protein ACK5TK_07605 [Betaproteobacteria bacterium]